MSKTKSSQKKVSLSELNNHTTTNKRQALKDLNKLSEASKDNRKLNLIIAINYGSRQEITSSVKKIAHDIALKKIYVRKIFNFWCDRFDRFKFIKTT